MNIVESRSLDPMAPLDDLEPLLDLVGDARVVAIGESSHHVREFYLLRHRLLRFLVERRGFTVYALEAPFTDAHTIDAWVRGGPGTVEQVASAGIDHGMGDCREMHDLLRWMREHERPMGTMPRAPNTSGSISANPGAADLCGWSAA
ncbi:erythromycin esterase family protein, partial [Nonomuraea sp. NPDC055795]